MSKHDRTLPLTLEQRARRRVALKTGFLTHALVFVLVNLGVYLLAHFGGWWEPGGRWQGRIVGLPMWGWGLGLAIHGTVVFLKLQGEGLKQGMIDREIESLKRREVA